MVTIINLHFQDSLGPDGNVSSYVSDISTTPELSNGKREYYNQSQVVVKMLLKFMQGEITHSDTHDMSKNLKPSFGPIDK